MRRFEEETFHLTFRINDLSECNGNINALTLIFERESWGPSLCNQFLHDRGLQGKFS